MRAETFRPPWLGAAVLAAITIVASDRGPRIEIASESKWSAFGHQIAADADVLVAVDLSASDQWSPVLRIVQARDARVTADTRFEYRRGDWPVALDVSNGRVVAQLESKRLDFYEQRGRTWKKVQSLELAGACRESQQFLDLADRVLVIGADTAICVYELRGTRWQETAQLPIVSALDEPKTNGDRIAQHGITPDRIRLSRRDSAGEWRIDRELPAPSRRMILSFAIGSHWLAVTTSDFNFEQREIQVYALGTTVAPVATLRSQADDSVFGFQLALSGDRLIASGATHQLFAFSGGSWRADRVLATSVFGDQVALGALAWVGRRGGETDIPGVIAGYEP